MPRSAADATRFTSTTPHASSPPNVRHSNSNGSGGNGLGRGKGNAPAGTAGRGGLPGETMQEKVRRLRMAADRAKMGEISRFDRFLVRGRVWADTAHKVTALSLIGATFIAGGVTVYALGDMMIYNRKKRREFFTQQEALRLNALRSAIENQKQGIATEEQIAFLDREAEHARWLEERKNRKGVFRRGREWLFSGLKKEEEGENVGSSERRLGYEGLSEVDDEVLGERESDIVRAIEQRKLELQDKVGGAVKKAFEDEREKQRSGGPLDRIGTPTESTTETLLHDPAESEKSNATVKSESKGWFSWVTGR